jgi:hypothetical protein
MNDMSMEQQQYKDQLMMEESQREMSNEMPVVVTDSSVDVLIVENLTEARNFTCRAHNTYGLVVFNLSLVIKGNLLNIVFFFYFCFILSSLSLNLKSLSFLYY